MPFLNDLLVFSDGSRPCRRLPPSEMSVLVNAVNPKTIRAHVWRSGSGVHNKTPPAIKAEGS